MSNMKRRAFTLIELMVVASIIILVAAVAIPAIEFTTHLARGR